MAPRVLIIIPALNEADSIGRVVRRIRDHMPDTPVLVVDDGSADDTAGEARSAGAKVLTLPYNLGIGGAEQAGFLYALDHNYDIVVRLDADGQHRPEEIPGLLESLERDGVDLVIGSRFVGESDYRAPFARRIGIRLFAALLSRICGQRLTDTTSGFRAAKRGAVAVMAQTHSCDYPEIESLITLHKAGFLFAERPARMEHRAAGESSINALAAFYYVAKVLLAVLVDITAPARCTKVEIDGDLLSRKP